jgi:hypothetical protein
MANKIAVTLFLILAIGCTSDHSPSKAQLAREKEPAELNVVKDVVLEIRSSNESDESNYHKATLNLTDYDKDKGQPVVVIDGIFDNGKNTGDFTPYVNEICLNGGICGITFTTVNDLENITLEQAIGEVNRTGLHDANLLEKNKFTNGALLINHSEIRENDKSPVWSITVAIELVDFKKNAKRVKLRYKVLQYKIKE